MSRASFCKKELDRMSFLAGGGYDPINMRIAGGTQHSVLYDYKTIIGIGSNKKWQLGIKKDASVPTILPLTLEDDETIKSIKCGYYSTMVVTNKKIYATGENFNHSLSKADEDLHTFTTIIDTNDLPAVVKDVKCAGYSYFLRLVDGSIYVTSYDTLIHTLYEGYLGDSVGPFYRLAIDFGSKLIDFDISDSHMFFITDSNIYAVGSNEHGQLGLSKDIEKSLKLVKTPNDKQIVRVTCGADSTYLVSKDLKLYVSGSNTKGQIGLKSRTDFFEFERNNFGKNVAKVYAGESNVIYVTDDGIYASGSNKMGENGLPQSSSAFNLLPTKLEIKGVRKVYTFYTTTFLITDTNILASGANFDGQLFIKTKGKIFGPTPIDSVENPIKGEAMKLVDSLPVQTKEIQKYSLKKSTDVPFGRIVLHASRAVLVKGSALYEVSGNTILSYQNSTPIKVDYTKDFVKVFDLGEKIVDVILNVTDSFGFRVILTDSNLYFQGILPTESNMFVKKIMTPLESLLSKDIAVLSKNTINGKAIDKLHFIKDDSKEILLLEADGMYYGLLEVEINGMILIQLVDMPHYSGFKISVDDILSSHALYNSTEIKYKSAGNVDNSNYTILKLPDTNMTISEVYVGKKSIVVVPDGQSVPIYYANENETKLKILDVDLNISFIRPYFKNSFKIQNSAEVGIINLDKDELAYNGTTFSSSILQYATIKLHNYIVTKSNIFYHGARGPVDVAPDSKKFFKVNISDKMIGIQSKINEFISIDSGTIVSMYNEEWRGLTAINNNYYKNLGFNSTHFNISGSRLPDVNGVYNLGDHIYSVKLPQGECVVLPDLPAWTSKNTGVKQLTGTKYNHIYLKKSFNILEPNFFDRVVSGGNVELDGRTYSLFVLSNGNIWGLNLGKGNDAKFQKIFALKSIFIDGNVKLMSEQEKISSCKYFKGTIVATTTKKGKVSYPLVIDGSQNQTVFNDKESKSTQKGGMRFTRLTIKADYFGVYTVDNYEKTYLIRNSASWLCYDKKKKKIWRAYFFKSSSSYQIYTRKFTIKCHRYSFN